MSYNKNCFFPEPARYSPPECEVSPSYMRDCFLQGSVDGISDLAEEDMDWL